MYNYYKSYKKLKNIRIYKNLFINKFKHCKNKNKRFSPNISLKE